MRSLRSGKVVAGAKMVRSAMPALLLSAMLTANCTMGSNPLSPPYIIEKNDLLFKKHAEPPAQPAGGGNRYAATAGHQKRGGLLKSPSQG